MTQAASRTWVTKRTYDEFHGTNDEEGMRALTVEDVLPIYRRNYWSDVAARPIMVSTGLSWTPV